MTREEQLVFCSVCKNRAFNPKTGIICNITMKVADFEYKCDNFIENEKEAELVDQKKEALKGEVNKSINQGRIALFVLAGIYIVVGFLESFYIDFHNIVFGIIDWGVAVCFLGLAIWSFSKPYFALLSGLILYLLIIVILALIDPVTIFSGIIWKVLIITYLIYATKTAKEEKSKIIIKNRK